MRLSIVIPTYNTAAMTLRCCEAALAAAPDAEVIVADDASTDRTAELLPERVRVVRLARNGGFATAANAGVAAANGEIILLLNSDAVIDQSAIHALLDGFESDPKLGIAGAHLLNPDGSAQWSGGQAPTLAWLIGVVSGAGRFARLFRRRRESAAVTRDVDWVSGAAMAFRDAVWRACGPLSERFVFYAQDLDFCMRARRHGWSVAVVENARVVHALGSSIANNSELHHDPELLWHDLLLWYGDEHGRARAALARRLLFVLAILRVTWRRVRLKRDATTSALTRAARRLAHNDA